MAKKERSIRVLDTGCDCTKYSRVVGKSVNLKFISVHYTDCGPTWSTIRSWGDDPTPDMDRHYLTCSFNISVYKVLYSHSFITFKLQKK